MTKLTIRQILDIATLVGRTTTEIDRVSRLIGGCVEAIGGLVMAAVVEPEKCEGCGTCVDTCPSAAIELKDGKAVVDAQICADCGACVDACPTQAIEIP